MLKPGVEENKVISHKAHELVYDKCNELIEILIIY